MLSLHILRMYLTARLRIVSRSPFELGSSIFWCVWRSNEDHCDYVLFCSDISME